MARICIDPGIGFGKTVQQNFALLGQQAALLPLGYPLLAGWSRKSSLAAVTGRSLASVATLDVRPIGWYPSVAAALLAVQNGAHVVRVHDVKETVQALKVLKAPCSKIASSSAFSGEAHNMSKKIFWYRWHPRHGRAGHRSPRTS
jgi:dihydropteroate synthase